jgi:hypothetical protein
MEFAGDKVAALDVHALEDTGGHAGNIRAETILKVGGLYGISRGKRLFSHSTLRHNRAIHESALGVCWSRKVEELVCSS